MRCYCAYLWIQIILEAWVRGCVCLFFFFKNKREVIYWIQIVLEACIRALRLFFFLNDIICFF
jgi:putative effector of murein hydrolase LrgA (UPF0299 family)